MKCAATSDASCSNEAGSRMCCANWNQCCANTGNPFSAGSFEPGIGTVAHCGINNPTTTRAEPLAGSVHSRGSDPPDPPHRS